ncbi:hypothetical protein HJG60_010429 [Phyllostomus discolor]|uniref:Uncharacterized protein n=1 Tax=Phyllostomus discolor TaxID=89673 RepID=A0A834AMZ1_9CHIR|nr:hypothetical protein HJG60_010429 [Phyllostomus discolor]
MGLLLHNLGSDFCLISENSSVPWVLGKPPSVGIFLSHKDFTLVIFPFSFSMTSVRLTLALERGERKENAGGFAGVPDARLLALSEAVASWEVHGACPCSLGLGGQPGQRGLCCPSQCRPSHPGPVPVWPGPRGVAGGSCFPT